MPVDLVYVVLALLIGGFLGAALMWALQQRTSLPATNAPPSENEAYLQTVFDSVRTPIFIVNVEADGGFRMAMINPAYREQAPFPMEHVLGKRIEDSPIIAPEMLPHVRSHYDACVKSGESMSYEEHVFLEGKPYWFMTSLNPVKDATGKVYRLVGMSIDMTEQRLAAQQAVDLALERERSRILTHFIRDASHEFRTPLSIIRTGLYLIEKQPEPDERQRRLRQIEEQTDLIGTLVDDLQTLVRLDDPQPFKLSRLSLDMVATGACEQVRKQAEKSGLVLEKKSAESDPFICGDVTNLTRAISEILYNALHFTPKGGTITVETSRQDENAMVVVRDNGMGMDDDTQQQAFNRFYRKDSAHTTAGLGLGLPIARKIIEAHSGKIELESALNVGTTVTIRLPIFSEKTPNS